MENKYLGREGFLDDTKPTLRENQKLQNNMNSYDEEFLYVYLKKNLPSYCLPKSFKEKK